MKSGGAVMTNCQRCGRVMLKGALDVCPSCYEILKEHLQKCLRFLRHNDEVTLEQLSKATDVSTKQIQELIRWQYISPRLYPRLLEQVDG